MKRLIKATLVALIAPLLWAAPAHAAEPTFVTFVDAYSYPSGRVLLAVQILSGDPRCELGRTVKLQGRESGSVPWSTLGSDVTTYTSSAAMNVGALPTNVRLVIPKKKLSDGTVCAAPSMVVRHGDFRVSRPLGATAKLAPLRPAPRKAAIATPQHELLLTAGVFDYILAGGFADVPTACRVGREVFVDITFNMGGSWAMVGRDRSGPGGAWGITLAPNLGTGARFRSPAATINGTACPAIVTPIST